jgi:hypothetical protein
VAATAHSEEAGGVTSGAGQRLHGDRNIVGTMRLYDTSRLELHIDSPVRGNRLMVSIVAGEDDFVADVARRESSALRN